MEPSVLVRREPSARGSPENDIEVLRVERSRVTLKRFVRFICVLPYSVLFTALIASFSPSTENIDTRK